MERVGSGTRAWQMGQLIVMTRAAKSWRRAAGRLLTAAGLVLAAAALPLALPGHAQDAAKEKPPSNAAAKTVSPQKETQIRKLLDLTGAKQNAADFGQQLGDYLKTMLQKSLPPGSRNEEIGNTLVAKLRERLNSDELIVRLVPVYDKAFTESDLSGIISFYESPPGRKLLDATPKVMEEANNVSEQWIREMLPPIMAQMEEQYPELKQPDSGAPVERPKQQ